jgi:hypothetical protein
VLQRLSVAAIALVAVLSSLGSKENAARSVAKFACDVEGFSTAPIETIVHLTSVTRLRSVAGIITLSGYAPDGYEVLFEVRPRLRSGPIQTAKLDSKGRFQLKGLAPGQYCFKITAYGWESLVGVVEVDRQADGRSRLVLDLPIGH